MVVVAKAAVGDRLVPMDGAIVEENDIHTEMRLLKVVVNNNHNKT